MLTTRDIDTLKAWAMACLVRSQNVIRFVPRIDGSPQRPDTIHGMIAELDERVRQWDMGDCESLAELLTRTGNLNPVSLGVDVYPTAHEAAWRLAKGVSDIAFELDLSAATPHEWADHAERRLSDLPSSQHLEAAILCEYGDAQRLVDPIYRNPAWFLGEHGVTAGTLRGLHARGVIRREGQGQHFTYSVRDVMQYRPDLVDILPA